MKKKILVVYAHPDDESFSIGGTLLKYLKEGNAEIILICATRGEAGSCGNPAICLPEELGEVRTEELKAAAKILGIKQIFFPGFRDGTLDKFSVKFLADIIYPVFVRERPDIVITFPPNGISGHPDHIQISRVATSVFEKYRREVKRPAKLYYSTVPQSLVNKLRRKGLIHDVFRRPFAGTPEDKITTVIDIAKYVPTKWDALMQHKTQHQDWEKFINYMKHVYADKEYFVLVKANIRGVKEKETDLFSNFPGNFG